MLHRYKMSKNNMTNNNAIGKVGYRRNQVVYHKI